MVALISKAPARFCNCNVSGIISCVGGHMFRKFPKIGAES